jgi:hypothetical protein
MTGWSGRVPARTPGCWRAFSLVMTRSLIVVMERIVGLVLVTMVVTLSPVVGMAVVARR